MQWKGFGKIIVRKKTQLDLKNQKKTFEFLNKIKPKIVIICTAKVGGIKANNNKRADFLIDKNGIIQEAYYGKDEGDHLHFDTIKEFSLI